MSFLSDIFRRLIGAVPLTPIPDPYREEPMPDLQSAAEYIRARLASGQLTHDDLARLVVAYQQSHDLDADGKPGPATLAKLRPAALRKVYPLPVLPDLRKPQITSGHKSRNPSRPNHDGCDLFYRWQESDGAVKLGDGGATRDAAGKPRWFIPAGLCAIAAADGVVSAASKTPTGWRVWINHADGNRTGYFHLRDARVTKGQEVSAGHPLGEVGDNPRDTDAEHLHFEVSPIGRYAPIDPETWLVGATYFAG